MRAYNGIHVTAVLGPGGAGYRAGVWRRGVLAEVLYVELIPPGSPAAWLDKARLNAIRHADKAKVKPEK